MSTRLQMYTVDTLAKKLGITRKEAMGLISSGQICAHNMGTKAIPRYFITEFQLCEYNRRVKK